jgi:hypothetical protein
MTTATETVVSADDFDAAFEEAIKTEGSGEANVARPAASAVEAKPAGEVTPAIEAKPAGEVTPATVVAPIIETAPVIEAKPATVVAPIIETAPVIEAKPATVVAPVVVAPSAQELAETAARKVADETEQRRVATEATNKKAEEARQAAEIKDPVLTEEQTKKITDFEKEWPDVAAAVKVQMAHDRAQLETNFARALTAIVQKVYGDMAPMAEAATNSESSRFRGEVLKAHPDFDVVQPQLEPWIAKQPAYLTEAYRRVYNEGNAQEVNDLLTRFKAANGVGSPASGTTTPTGKTTPEQPTEAQLAAKKAAAELAPTSGKRSIPAPSGLDPNDYDGAFAEAAAQYK